MISKKIKFQDAEFAGIKIIMDGVSIQQVADTNMALQRASNLDPEATEFEYIKKDGTTKIIKK